MKKKKKSNDILYLSLQQSFIKLRSLFSSDTPKPNKLDAVLGDLRFARKRLQKYAKEINLGFLYHLNKAFTVLFVLTFALTFLTGLKKEMALLLCPLHIFVYMLSAVTTAFYRIQNNLDFHGTPFVIFARSSNGGVDSVIFDAVMIGMSFMPAYAVLLMTAEIWGISLPNL